MPPSVQIGWTATARVSRTRFVKLRVLGVRLPPDKLTSDVFCRAVMTSPYFLATGEWRHASVHRMVELDRDTEFAAPPRVPYTA
jgi:hypothetical protein